MFYIIGVSDVISRHVATVPQNNDPSVAKGLKSHLGHILDTARCRKLILGWSLVGECRCTKSWCDL